MAYNEEWRLNARDRDEIENENVMIQYHSMVFGKFLDSLTNPKPDTDNPTDESEEEKDKDKTIPWGKKDREEPPLFIGS